MSLLRRPKLDVRRKRLLLIAASLLLTVPCVAAASFAFSFDIEPQNSIMTSQQEPSKEGREKKEKELQARREREEQEMQREDQELRERVEKEANPETRAKLEAELHRMQEERAQARREGWTVTFQGNPSELRTRRAQEDAEKKARQAELVRQAKITMDQAIQIATSQQPGKVLECSLIGEHWESPGKLAKDGVVLYHVVILSGDDSNPTTAHVLINAADGSVWKNAKEERTKEPRREPR